MVKGANLISTHWTGRLPFGWALGGPLVICGVILVAGFMVLPEGTTARVWAISALVVLIWSFVGAFRTTDRHLKEGGTGAAATLSYGLMLICGLVVGDRIFSTLAGPGVPKVYVEPARAPSNLTFDGGNVVLDGDITLSTYNVTREYIEAGNQVREMHLNSQGGSVSAARGLARLLLESGADTHVTGVCLSACPLVFMAGEKRTLAPDSRLGFHQYFLHNREVLTKTKLIDEARERQRDEAFYLSRGISKEFVARIFDTPHQGIWVPEATFLQTSGVLSD